MGDVSLAPGAEANRPFSADQLFDSRSVYGRMRASLKPEAKLRGFFHCLAVAKAKQGDPPHPPRARTKPPGVAELIVRSTAPEQGLDADLSLDLAPGAGGGRLLVSFRIKDRAAIPPEGTACRALLLTAGMLERLCGAEATRSSDAARKAVAGVLAGRSDSDPFETARILAALPEMDGKLDEGGFCKFKPFDLPEQAANVDHLPERMTVVVVIDRPRD